jgi:hypothetical protein
MIASVDLSGMLEPLEGCAKGNSLAEGVPGASDWAQRQLEPLSKEVSETMIFHPRKGVPFGRSQDPPVSPGGQRILGNRDRH